MPSVTCRALAVLLGKEKVEAAAAVRLMVEADCRAMAPAALLPMVTAPVEVPVLMLVGWLLETFKSSPPEPDKRVVVEVVLEDPRLTVLTPAPLPKAIVWVPVPPRVTVEVVEPVPMSTAKLEEAFRDTAAPLTVSPAEPVNSPAEVMVPVPVVEMLPEVVTASPAVAGCRVVPDLDQYPTVPSVVRVISPVQAKAPVALVTVQPVAPLPPASRTLPVEVAPIETVPAPLASRVKASSVPEERADRAMPPPEAAAVIFRPVTELAVLVSTWRA